MSRFKALHGLMNSRLAFPITLNVVWLIFPVITTSVSLGGEFFGRELGLFQNVHSDGRSESLLCVDSGRRAESSTVCLGASWSC